MRETKVEQGTTTKAYQRYGEEERRSSADGIARRSRPDAFILGLALPALVLLACPLADASPRRVLEPLLWDASQNGARTLRRAHPAAALSGGLLRVLVRLKPGVSPAVLSGFDAERAAGTVVPVRVAPDRLQRLASTPGVLVVEACRTLHAHLDRSLPETGALSVYRNHGLNGAGVIVGIIDTGLDFRHEDFQTAGGRTRVAYLLDFSKEAKDPKAKWSFGARAFSRTEIDTQLIMDRTMSQQEQGLVTHRDLAGHGTHVAGIAAGSGAAAAPGFTAFRYKGVAPGATLIGVQASENNSANFHDADVIHGIQFVFERAEALGMPAVVNLSIGTQLGPHDGTSGLAMAISSFTGDHKPGRVVVVSAGNDGGQDIHAVGFPRIDGASRVTLQVPHYAPSPARELAHLEVWYSGGQLSVEITSPGGRTIGPVPTGQLKEVLTDEGMVKVLNAPGGAYPSNGRYKAAVIVEERGKTSVAPGGWSLGLAGSARRYDVYLANPAILGPSGRPGLRGGVETASTLASPGDARGVISVGAYSTRGMWKSMAGKVAVTSVQQGQHAYFSSTGPTLDGRFLPDVSAPGEFIISALSRHANPLSPASSFHVADYPGALWHEDNVRGLLRGTSQAAPHVAGVAALLLQRDPRLTVDQVRELLRVGARTDATVGAGRAWSNRWGFGKVDAARSLAVLDGEAAGAVDPARSEVATNRDLLPPGSDLTARVTVIPRDAAGRPLGAKARVQLTTTAGYLFPPRHVARGRFEAVLTPEGAPVGATARITARVNGVQLHHQPLVHLSTRRAMVGQSLRAHGGGCDMGGGAESWLAVLLMLAALRTAVRRFKG